MWGAWPLDLLHYFVTRIYSTFSFRFSSKVLTIFCQQTENRPLAGIIVIGEGQSARAVALAGTTMNLPVLWAKGGTASLNGKHKEVSTKLLLLRDYPSGIKATRCSVIQQTDSRWTTHYKTIILLYILCHCLHGRCVGQLKGLFDWDWWPDLCAYNLRNWNIRNITCLPICLNITMDLVRRIKTCCWRCSLSIQFIAAKFHVPSSRVNNWE